MNTTYLLLGSNIGDSKTNLIQAAHFIATEIGEIEKSSSIYSTKAWGNTDQADFLNQILIVNTKVDAFDMMDRILGIEKKMGRIRSVKNAPRVIDIDILFYNNEIINTKDLIIPHPLMQERKFVLIPLNEVSPHFIHPVLNKNTGQILSSCKDELTVNKI